MTLFGQLQTYSTKSTSKSNSQLPSQFMTKPLEFSSRLTMNFSSLTNSKPHSTLSVLWNQTKLNIYSDLLPNNLWLTHLISSVRAQKVWMYSFIKMLQAPPKWQNSQRKKQSLIMEWPKTVDLFSNIDAEVLQDGEDK